MNKEILFRAKRKDVPKSIKTKNNSEWVEGYYVYFERMDNACIYYKYKGAPLVTDVDSKTVCQYIGLIDKNGRKIFEGDIIKYSDTLHKVIFENRFNTAYFGIVFKEKGEVWDFGHMCSSLDMIVVGNIFDNPELLEQS